MRDNRSRRTLLPCNWLITCFSVTCKNITSSPSILPSVPKQMQVLPSSACLARAGKDLYDSRRLCHYCFSPKGPLYNFDRNLGLPKQIPCKGCSTSVNRGHPRMNGDCSHGPPDNTDSYNAFSWHTDFSN